MASNGIILKASGLKRYFPVTKGVVLRKTLGYVKAVDDVDFEIRHGETFGLVGESGCGKTTLAKLLLLIETPTDGVIEFEGKNINQLDSEELRYYRSSVQTIFQDPYSSLNPRIKIWETITEPLVVGASQGTAQAVSRKQAQDRAAELLETVGLPPDSSNRYPHQFSGGQRQRIAIARALASNPKFLVLDEPVSALDVSIRAQIMNLLKELQKRFNLTLLIIAHDLAVVRYMSDTIGVMYLGKMVERGPAERVYTNPMHPYTQALLSSALPFDPDAPRKDIIIRGEVPSPLNPPAGCRFHPRCPSVMPQCSGEVPALKDEEPGHKVACYLY